MLEFVDVGVPRDGVLDPIELVIESCTVELNFVTDVVAEMVCVGLARVTVITGVSWLFVIVISRDGVCETVGEVDCDFDNDFCGDSEGDDVRDGDVDRDPDFESDSVTSSLRDSVRELVLLFCRVRDADFDSVTSEDSDGVSVTESERDDSLELDSVIVSSRVGVLVTDFEMDRCWE